MADSYRWKHVVAGVATLAAIALIAVSRCTPEPPATVARPAATPIVADRLPTPAVTGAALAEWRAIVDLVRADRLADAERALAAWVTAHGETAETRGLAARLIEQRAQRP